MCKSLRQVNPLIKKNIILFKRNIRATVVQLLVPVLFIAFLFLLQLANAANQRISDRISLVRDSRIRNINSIPPCIIGPGKGKCYTLGYSPSTDPNVVKLIQWLQKDQQIPDEKLISFKTQADANLYLFQNPNTTQAILHVVPDYGCDSPKYSAWQADLCHATTHPQSELIGIKYAIQRNTTAVYVVGYNLDMANYLNLPLQKAMDRAIFNTFGKDTSKNTTWDWDPYQFPHPEITPINVVSTAGPFVIFGALMFNFVIQIGAIVTEKETKVRESMRVMGLRDWVYWLSWGITNSVTNILSVFILILSGLAFQFPFFLKNDFGTYFFLLLLFAIAMIPLAFFLSTLVSKTDTSSSAGFAIFIIGILMQTVAPLVFDPTVSDGVQGFFSIFPFALLAKGLSDLGSETSSELSSGMRFSDVSDSTRHYFPLSVVYTRLIMDMFIFSVLTWYFDNVLYMGRKPWFLFTPSYWRGGSGRNTKLNEDEDEDSYELEDMDADVVEEKNLIRGNQLDPELTQVVLENLQKTYKGTKFFCIPDKGNYFRAVKGIDLTINSGQLLCLLGHNGAGKSTTIGMLTGLFPCSGGDASIFGFSITTDMSDIRRVMGVCPQHDILWKSLTAEEHLELFAVLRDIPKDKIEEEVSERLKDVDLTFARKGLAGSFSGGMQRRLSVAIALIGNPKIVFLDEPTTGMDPISRRKVWNLIEKVKRGRVTLLTTHSMEEADILADKIAIMKDGRIATIGTSLRLKKKFGTGYDISILAKEGASLSAIRKFVDNQLNQDDEIAKFEDQSKLGILKFNVPREHAGVLPKFFKNLEAKEEKLKIKDYQVNLSTLEEVFINVAATEQKEKKVEKKKKNKCIRIVIGVVVTIILIAIIIIIVRRTMPKAAPPPPTAPDLGKEVSSYLPPGEIDRLLFPSGIQVSEVTSTRALLLVRTLATQLSLSVLQGSDAAWTALPALGLTNIPTYAYGSYRMATVELPNLQAATLYSVVFQDPNSGNFSAPTRFRTPFPDKDRKIKFGASSGFGKTNLPYPNLQWASKQLLDFFLLDGNLVYPSNATFTAAQYADLYTEVLKEQGFYELSQSTTFFFAPSINDIVDPHFSFSAGRKSVGFQAVRDAFGVHYGDANVTHLYRRVSWGNAIDIFMLDVVTEANATQLISETQMSWLQEELSASTCSVKLILSPVPISDLLSIGVFLTTPTWQTFPKMKNEIINYIDYHNISGVVWITGGYDFSLLRTGHDNTNVTSISPYTQLEVLVGPSGTRINPSVVLSSLLDFAGTSFKTIIDTWTYTYFIVDPVEKSMLVSFIDDNGNPIKNYTLNFDYSDFALKKPLAPLPYP